MTPVEYCQDKAAKSGSSFYYAFLFLPPDRRLAITALYAFCREVDDVVDECSDPSVARIKLAWWRTQVDKLFNGQPEHPVTQALQPWLDTYGLACNAIAGMWPAWWETCRRGYSAIPIHPPSPMLKS